MNGVLAADDRAGGIERDRVTPGEGGLRGKNAKHSGKLCQPAGLSSERGARGPLQFAAPGVEGEPAQGEEMIGAVLAQDGEEGGQSLPALAQRAVPAGLDESGGGIEALGAVLEQALGEKEDC